MPQLHTSPMAQQLCTWVQLSLMMFVVESFTVVESCVNIILVGHASCVVVFVASVRKKCVFHLSSHPTSRSTHRIASLDLLTYALKIKSFMYIQHEDIIIIKAGQHGRMYIIFSMKIL